jgi:hypothetical protein
MIIEGGYVPACDGTGTGTRIPELLLIERAPHFKMTKGKNQQS